jgi:hypothetical protein
MILNNRAQVPHVRNRFSSNFRNGLGYYHTRFDVELQFSADDLLAGAGTLTVDFEPASIPSLTIPFLGVP